MADISKELMATLVCAKGVKHRVTDMLMEDGCQDWEFWLEQANNDAFVSGEDTSTRCQWKLLHQTSFAAAGLCWPPSYDSAFKLLA